jgi:hypothetical protein
MHMMANLKKPMMRHVLATRTSRNVGAILRGERQGKE